MRGVHVLIFCLVLVLLSSYAIADLPPPPSAPSMGSGDQSGIETQGTDPSGIQTNPTEVVNPPTPVGSPPSIEQPLNIPSQYPQNALPGNQDDLDSRVLNLEQQIQSLSVNQRDFVTEDDLVLQLSDTKKSVATLTQDISGLDLRLESLQYNLGAEPSLVYTLFGISIGLGVVVLVLTILLFIQLKNYLHKKKRQKPLFRQLKKHHGPSTCNNLNHRQNPIILNKESSRYITLKI